VRLERGAADLAGIPGVESLNDHGNYQDVRITGDTQAFLQALVQRTRVQQFEITTPSLHDIFIRIAKPGPDEIDSAEGAA
jgi:ABC-2 type transport system ATP-binding protein